MRIPTTDADGCAAHSRIWSHAPLNSGRVYERFKTGTSLAIGLGGIIKLARAVEIVSADHGYDFTRLSIERDHCALHARHLRQLHFELAVLLVDLLDLKLTQVSRLQLVFWLAMGPPHVFGSDCGSVVAETHSGLVGCAVDLHDQPDQKATFLVVVAIPVSVFEVRQLLLRWDTRGVSGGNNIVLGTPSCVAAIVTSQSSSHDFVSLLLRIDVDGGID